MKFWDKVSVAGIDACWEWARYKYPNGYGKFSNGTRHGYSTYAHRAAYELTKGEIPPGMFICHKCDNKACVNPSHLFVGTPADNSKDMCNKNRQIKQRGSRNNNARLTAEDVAVIRSDRRPAKDVAREYGVCAGHIYNIRGNSKWK